MKEHNYSPENISPELKAREILNNNPGFKGRANEISAILGYNKKFYALGLVDINQEGEHKGHANNSRIDYWHDYGKFIPYIDFLRQIDLHLENKLDKYIGGRDEANYNFNRDHYILYETRILKDPEKEGLGGLHVDDSDNIYLYETGTRDSNKLDINDPNYTQETELIKSMQLPQGPITKEFYLKHSRACPLDKFLEACQESDTVDDQISEVDSSNIRVAKDYFNSYSYKLLTSAAEFVDKEKYDYVRLPNGHLVVINKDVLIDPKEIADQELSGLENKRLEEMYAKYLVQDKSNVTRGSEEDLKQFTEFLQSL